MRYIRNFDPKQISNSDSGQWVIEPKEQIGCSLKIRRGADGGGIVSRPYERFALVLAGEAWLQCAESREPAPAGSAIFIPSGQPGNIGGSLGALLVEIEAEAQSSSANARVVKVDPSRFEGTSFAHQTLIDRTIGACSMRINTLRVQPGAGSPDFHIHASAQMYIMLEGEMTIDVGRTRFQAGPNSIVVLPPGVVHRNFNGTTEVERHMSLLVPEPIQGAIFDYAVQIHEHEAALMERAPT